MSYSVRIVPTAIRHIESYGKWFAERREVPTTAERWVTHILDQISNLSSFPKKCELAAEDASMEYEVRRLRIGHYLALFTIDEASNTVFVLAFRHGQHLPVPE